jgi:small subunit ribosomal protein S8
MSVTDTIADAITKIRNAYQARHLNVSVNHSNMAEAIVRILDEENYINSFDVIERDPKQAGKQIYINLRYTNSGAPVVRGLVRISKPGRRVYVNADSIPSVYNNTGCAVISTPMGLMVDRKAREEHVGGEYVCKVW